MVFFSVHQTFHPLKHIYSTHTHTHASTKHLNYTAVLKRTPQHLFRAKSVFIDTLLLQPNPISCQNSSFGLFLSLAKEGAGENGGTEESTRNGSILLLNFCGKASHFA